MPQKSVFISSTFKDLKEYRRHVWEALKGFDVIVRGMEEFGAHTRSPLDTCLAEVEDCDVYIGIIAYRLGSIEPNRKQPFTILEYEKAKDQNKEILIYLADDESATFPQSLVDPDPKSRRRLEAFKQRLLENHTVGKFSTPKDLVEKLKGDFKKRFDKSSNEVPDGADEDKFNKSAILLKAFLLTPKRYNGYQVKINVSFLSSVFPASRSLCRNFNLTYGLTVGAFARIENPPDPHSKWGFREIYAEGNNIDEFISVVKGKKADVYAQLQFSEEDVNKVQAEFLGKTYYDDGSNGDDDPNEVYVAPEGKVILLFTKSV